MKHFVPAGYMLGRIARQVLDLIMVEIENPQQQTRIREKLLNPLMKYLFWRLGPIIMGMYLLLLVILVIQIMTMYRLNDL